MTFNRRALVSELQRDEGYRRAAYQDHLGYWTIGIGRLVDRRRGGGISLDEARYLLDKDIERFEAELDAKLPWWRTLDDVRQRVLLNMAFNLGVPGLLKFKRTLASVRNGDYGLAAAQMLQSKWAGQVGPRATRLSGMMRTGEA